MEEKQKLIESGELTIGEPCTPYTVTKCINSSGELEVRPSEICGRKISLRKRLLTKQQKYMRIFSSSGGSGEKLIQTAKCAGYRIPPDLLAKLMLEQQTRTIAIWHDLSTILRTGYIIFAVWFPIVFFTDQVYARQTRKPVSSLQEIVEENESFKWQFSRRATSPCT